MANPDLAQEGYLFLAFGESYIQDACDVIETLRANKDFRSTDIVVLPEHYELAHKKFKFNNIITFDPKQDKLYNNCTTSFEKNCLLPRLRFSQFIKYQYTMVLDTDVLCCYNTDNVWNFFKKQNQGVTMIGSKHNPFWHWGCWEKICESLQIKCYETHGGLFFFNKNFLDQIKETLKWAEHSFLNFDKFGFKRFYQGGAVDEPCFAYAFNLTNQVPVNFNEFSIMTFNLNSNDEIPTQMMTEQFQYCKMSEYIPYIHMFEKNQGSNFRTLYNKILENDH